MKSSFLLGSEGWKKKKKISNGLRGRKRLKNKFFMDFMEREKRRFSSSFRFLKRQKKRFLLGSAG